MLSLLKSFGPLGWTSFGGPAAHLGYFRTEFVSRRGWLSDAAFADIVAISQFLPGPGSSKVGMTIGLLRGGYLGMAWSWLLFTLPSALLMTIFGLSVQGTNLADAGVLRGLLVAAVAVVAHALAGMAKSLLRTPLAWSLAVATCLAVAGFRQTPQLVCILVAGVLGAVFLRPTAPLADAPSAAPVVSSRAAWASLVGFFGLLAGLQVAAVTAGGWWWTRLNAFYQSGALVFGGGHVVLPLLEDKFVASGWLGQSEFLAGYSVAQAMPGPLFTFASYVGAVDRGVLGAVVGTVMIFLPGALLTIAALHFWSRWQAQPLLRGAFAGINGAVVGLLAAAWWSTIVPHGLAPRPLLCGVLAAALFAWLQWGKARPWMIAAAAAVAGAVLL